MRNIEEGQIVYLPFERMRRNMKEGRVRIWALILLGTKGGPDADSSDLVRSFVEGSCDLRHRMRTNAFVHSSIPFVREWQAMYLRHHHSFTCLDLGCAQA